MGVMVIRETEDQEPNLENTTMIEDKVAIEETTEMATEEETTEMAIEEETITDVTIEMIDVTIIKKTTDAITDVTKEMTKDVVEIEEMTETTTEIEMAKEITVVEVETETTVVVIEEEMTTEAHQETMTTDKTTETKWFNKWSLSEVNKRLRPSY